MKNSISVKFYVNQKKMNAAGLAPVYLRAVLNRRKIESLMFYLDPICFDGPGERVLKSCPGFQKLNLLIESKKKAVFEVVFLSEINNKTCVLTDIAKVLKADQVAKRICFFTFVNDIIKDRFTLVSFEHFRHWVASLSKLKKFRPVLYLDEIDVKFLMEYENYMRVKLFNCTNTVTKTLGFIRNWINIGVKMDLVSVSPFQNFALKKEKTKKRFLLWEDVLKLEGLLTSPGVHVKIKKVVTWFLFSCYTGLRYSDLKLLKHSNIKNNCIEIVQHKVNEAVRVPLSSYATKLMPAGKGFIFDMYTNQKCNDYLKLAAVAAGIDKNLTFHMSRHTFGTISLNIGIRLEVVSALMGHADIKTTKLYAHLIDKTIDREMMAWEVINKKAL